MRYKTLIIKKILTVIALIVFTAGLVLAKEYPIKSAKELAALKLNPGDKIVLQEGEWKDQELIFTGQGTAEKPIILTSAKPGKIILSGNSNLLITGSWLVADGLYFTNGFSAKKDVITLDPKTENCRLTNTAILDYNHPDKTFDYKWISVYGQNNRVDHCYLKGKTHQGTTLVVWLSDKSNYHRIDHNYFGHRPDLGVNGGETIRIGTSSWSMHDSYTTVENNIFDKCDGETEIISVKSGHNTIRNNIFYESSGMLTLRHGNNSTVYGNYFIGNGKAKSGGVRIIGENHRVFNNYFQGLAGTGITATISIMNGIPNSPFAGYYQVKNAQVVFNTIVDCVEPIGLGVGKNEERSLPPLNIVLSNNLIVTQGKLITWYDQPSPVIFAGNIVSGLKEEKSLPTGIKLVPIVGKKEANGIWRPAAKSPVIGAAAGDFSFVRADIDGQPRSSKKDVGADEVLEKTPPMLKYENIGPGRLKLYTNLQVN